MRAITLSIKFIASLGPDDSSGSKSTYLVTVDKNLTVTKVVPLASKTFGLVKVALDRGFLAPDDETFWRNALSGKSFPLHEAAAQKRITEFCKKNILSSLYDLKAQEKVNLTVYKHSNAGESVEFTGVITSVHSVEI